MSMWGGGFDPDLGSKIDQILAGKPSAKQRVEEFLVDELHVDPSKIPMSFNDAKTRVNELAEQRDAGSARFQGNSMGLAYVDFFKRAQDEPDGCPQCGTGAYVYDAGKNWHCDECEQDFTWSPSAVSSERVTERGDKATWDDLLRIYAALCKFVEPDDDDGGDAPDCEKCGASNAGNRRAPHLCEVCEAEVKPKRSSRAFTKFTITPGYGHANVTGIPDKPPRWKQATKYPTGTRLRITNGTDSLYVRIGGLFSDTDVVNLATMKPIEKVTSYSVVEVIDDADG